MSFLSHLDAFRAVWSPKSSLEFMEISVAGFFVEIVWKIRLYSANVMEVIGESVQLFNHDGWQVALEFSAEDFNRIEFSAVILEQKWQPACNAWMLDTNDSFVYTHNFVEIAWPWKPIVKELSFISNGRICFVVYFVQIVSWRTFVTLSATHARFCLQYSTNTWTDVSCLFAATSVSHFSNTRIKYNWCSAIFYLNVNSFLSINEKIIAESWLVLDGFKKDLRTVLNLCVP